jgi:hypothetical protein
MDKEHVESSLNIVLTEAVDQDRRIEIAEYLKTLGLSPVFMQTTEAENRVEVSQHLDTIISPDQFIIKEGLDNFQSSHHQQYSPHLITSFFSSLVETRDTKWRHDFALQRKADPTIEYVPQPATGIVIKLRSELNIPAYRSKQPLQDETFSHLPLTIGYAIQAGSIVDSCELQATIRDSGQERFIKHLSKGDRLQLAIRDLLLSQFEK